MFNNIVATLLARNEEDIIEQNIKHHIAQGIETFIFTDNSSTDRTREIVASFPQVKYIIDETRMNHDQGRWVTRMAIIAAEYKADWIIHLDADEFWCGLDGLANETFSGYLLVPAYRHLITSEHWTTFTRFQRIRETDKVIHRPSPDVVIAPGNHLAYRVGPKKKIDYVEVHHFPIRSYDQFERKVVQGTESLLKQSPGSILNVGIHWQRWYDIYKQGTLREEYERIMKADAEIVTSERFAPVVSNII